MTLFVFYLCPPRDKSKWAFSCRPTVMALGMAATQRTEGLFGVSKRAGWEKKLSLCALWEKVQRVNRSLEIELARRVSHDGLESSRFCGQRIAVPMLMYEAASIHVANSEGTVCS